MAEHETLSQSAMPPAPTDLAPDDRADFIESHLFKICVIVTVVLLTLLSLPLLTRQVPVQGDHLNFAIPIRKFYAESLRTGASLDWHPKMFAGFYITGEGQLGVYHPLHLVLYSVLPIDTAYALEFVIPFVVLVCGAFLFLRLYFDRNSAGFGAILMSFGVYAVYTSHFTNMSGVYCHIPWLLWLHARAFRAATVRERIKYAAGIAALTGSQILMGYPQIVVISLVVEVLFTLSNIFFARDWLVAPITIVCGKLGGLAVGAVQLLAGMELLPFTNRANWGAEAIYVHALRPVHLMGLVSPPFSGAYLGGLATVLLLWWLVAPRDSQVWNRERRALVAFGLMLSVVGTWLALGGHGGLYNLLAKLPIIDKLRASGRFMGGAAIGFAVLTAAAFDQFRRRVRRKTEPIRLSEKLAVWIPSLVYVAAMGYLAASGQLSDSHKSTTVYIYWPIIVGLVAWAAHAALIGKREAFVSLILLAGLDSGVTNWIPATCGQSWTDTRRYNDCVAVLEIPPVEPTKRIHAPASMLTNRFMLRGHSMYSGYAGMNPLRRLDEDHVRTWRVSGVQWMYDPTELSQSRDQLEEVRPAWFAVPDPLARIRLVADAVVSEQPAEDLLKIDIENQVLVDRPVDVVAGPVGNVETVSDQAGRIQLRTVCQKPELLCVADSYHPGWVVEIDGQPADLVRVNGDYMGTVVPAGTHEVVLKFAPRGLIAGRWISGLSCLGLLMVSGVLFVSNRRGGQQLENTTTCQPSAATAENLAAAA